MTLGPQHRLVAYATRDTPLTIAPASGDRTWMSGTTDGAAYRCPSLVAANLAGWLVVCTHDFAAAWNGGPRPEDLLIRTAGGAAGISSRHGNGRLTIDAGFVLRSEPGIDLLVTGPANAPRDGIVTLTSIIEADWSPVALHIDWAFTRRGGARFLRGEPVAQIFPLLRGLSERTALEARNDKNDPVLAYQRRALDVGQAFLAPQAKSAPEPNGGATAADRTVPRPPEPPTSVRGDHALLELAQRNIHCEENFLDEADCAALAGCFRPPADEGSAPPTGNAGPDNRRLGLTMLPDDAAACKAIMQRSRRAIIERLRRAFGITEKLYAESMELTKCERGLRMLPSADNANADGSPHKFAHRAFSAIVYLNEGYEGGLIYFPAQDVQILPRRGLLVMFPSDLSHVHGITAMTKGVQYTMPSWYTYDPRFRDPTDP